MTVFRRISDAGHATIFRSRVSGDQITIELWSPLGVRKIMTTLSKEDGKRFAEWLLERCK